jgi:hypothetical protein
VFQLNTLTKAATFDLAMKVARIVIDEFYSGNLSAWRERGPKDVSFRALAVHPRLSMSASALYRSVAIYELCDRLQINSQNHLSASHLRLVLPLAPESQARLLHDAESNRWSVRRLEEEISFSSSSSVRPRRGGRRQRSRLRVVLDALASCLNDFAAVRGVEVEMETEGANALLDLLARVRDACAIVEHRVSQVLPGAQTDPPPGDR